MRGDVADLLAGIRDHRREFEAAGSRAQELRTLPPETVQTLRDMGMFWLKTPAELGGTPLAPLDFCDVFLSNEVPRRFEARLAVRLAVRLAGSPKALSSGSLPSTARPGRP